MPERVLVGGIQAGQRRRKLHTLYDVRTSIPCFVLLTDALTHDVNALDYLPPFEPGGYYIMDKGYIDYSRLYTIAKAGAFFVTRAKANARFRRRYSAKVDKESGVMCDQTVMLSGFYAIRGLSGTASQD